MMRNFALVDIETTGGRATIDAITEIAVWILEENQVVSTWTSLVNPQQNIPSYIQRLTGISNEMVKNAPTFKEIASELFELLSGRIFVAHNARFDYGFIKSAFRCLDITFHPKILCTVKLSRALFPNQKSHSMDSLIARYGLLTKDRHRATGDVDLIWQFLTMCYRTLPKTQIDDAIDKIISKPSLPPYLETDINSIPNIPGVYLFYDDKESLPLYIGKSIELRTRVLSHFTNDIHHPKEMNLSKQVKHIEWIATTGELGALLLESRLIKEKMPIYNRRLRRAKKIFCFEVFEKDHYLHVKVVSTSENDAIQRENLYGAFRSKKQAENVLRELIELNSLCNKLCYLDHSSGYCFAYQLNKCKGACQCDESTITYNLRVQIALFQYKKRVWPYDGAIGIREYCPKQQIAQVHVVDQWQYLGTANNNEELGFILTSATVPQATSVDDVKYIQSYILNQSKRPSHTEILTKIQNNIIQKDRL